MKTLSTQDTPLQLFRPQLKKLLSLQNSDCFNAYFLLSLLPFLHITCTGCTHMYIFICTTHMYIFLLWHFLHIQQPPAAKKSFISFIAPTNLTPLSTTLLLLFKYSSFNHFNSQSSCNIINSIEYTRNFLTIFPILFFLYMSNQ